MADAQYPDHFIDRLEIVWGRGFLSPGGPEEVQAIVAGLDLKDRRVLDIGCGIGGPAVVLARTFGARMVGVDVEPLLIERARRFVRDADVAERVDLRLVAPGPLPFADGAFDAVFSKDSLIHIPDKAALYKDVLRVLRPGGVFAASDWLAGPDAHDDPAFGRFLRLAHLAFAMATAEETAAVMRAAGFGDVTTRDRTPWFAERARHDLAQVEGPLRDRLVEAAGREVYEDWIEVRRAMTAAAVSGALRPTHLRGRAA